MENGVSLILIELGVVIIALALLDRFARRLGISAIPLYLLVGLAFGNGGLLPLHLSQSFIQVGSQIGVLLLLFTLGLEYTGKQLSESLRSGLPDGIADFLLNFPPGFLAGIMLGWGSVGARSRPGSWAASPISPPPASSRACWMKRAGWPTARRAA
jgi:monovalent cation:H+ antiporter-2, CPA2 family